MIRHHAPARAIPPEELARRMSEGWAPDLFDVRTSPEWRRVRMTGFRRMPWRAAIRRAPSGPVVVAGRTGRRAALAARRMAGEVYVLAGGLVAWERAGLPVERGPAAPGLDRVLALVDVLGFRRWRAVLVGSARGRVLEVGAGTGRNAGHYRPGVTVVAVDPDHEALAFLRGSGRLPGGCLLCGRAETLPFRDGAFDSQVVTLVLCSVGDPDRAASELRRTLAPGGLLVGAEHVRAPGPIGALQHGADPAWHRLNGSCHIDREPIAALERSGLQVRVRGRRLGGIFVAYEATRAG